MNPDRRHANRRTALLVLIGMMTLAVVAIVFILATTDFRRLSDTTRPDMPPFWHGVVISLTIFFIASGIIALLFRKYGR
jgi:p-aminobenzoyl-glutamate transporter AbgT